MPRKKVQPETEIIAPVATPPTPSSVSLQALLVGIAILIMVGIIGYLYIEFQRTTQELNRIKEQQASQVIPVDETTSLLEELAQILVLPENEKPTLLTVTDLSKLGNQPFFEQAVVGDKVIIYSQSKKAILYRPSDKKVINIAPLTSELNTESTTESTVENTNN